MDIDPATAKFLAFATIGLILYGYFALGFFCSLLAVFALYCATGGWKFVKVVILTVPRDLRLVISIITVQFWIIFITPRTAVWSVPVCKYLNLHITLNFTNITRLQRSSWNSCFFLISSRVFFSLFWLKALKHIFSVLRFKTYLFPSEFSALH